MLKHNKKTKNVKNIIILKMLKDNNKTKILYV